MKKVEKIIEQIITNPEVADDELLGDRLLQQFHRGAPLDYLRPLLQSPDERLASLGAWIASELGEKGKPLLGIVGSLLRYPAKQVRFWAIDCVLLWAGPSDGREISQAIRLIDDPEKAVRWKAMDFLFRASRGQLESALAFMGKEEPVSPNVLGLRWLLSNAGRDAETVEAELRSSSTQMRKYAAAAAVRISKENRHPLLVAASSDDLDIANLADRWL